MRVVAVLFPELTQLDFAGPSQVLARAPGVKTIAAAQTTEPVWTDCGWEIVPTTTFDQAPQADVLLVPGGPGAFDALGCSGLIEFVRRQAGGARMVAATCTGAFILGAAGLLAGRRATTHWASMDMLAEFGAEPVRQRVVIDGLIATSAGVSAGIDLALQLVGDLFGEDVARRIQLQLEYDPQPPYDAGSVASAPEAWVADGIAAARAARLQRVQNAARLLA